MRTMNTELFRGDQDLRGRAAASAGLTYSTRKALAVHIGEQAGAEIADLIQRMATEIEELRRTKVSITRIVPGGEPR